MARKSQPTPTPGLIDPLRAAILASGLTSYALGKSTNVPAISIDRFLRGERGLSLETADRLARALGLTIVRPKEKET